MNRKPKSFQHPISKSRQKLNNNPEISKRCNLVKDKLAQFDVEKLEIRILKKLSEYGRNRDFRVNKARQMFDEAGDLINFVTSAYNFGMFSYKIRPN